MGMLTTISTDNKTMSHVTLDDEYDHCIHDMGLSEKDMIQMNLNAINASFLPEEEKEPVRRRLTELLKQC